MKSILKKAFGISLCLLGLTAFSACEDSKNDNNSKQEEVTHEYGDWEIAVLPTSVSSGTIKRKSLDSDDAEVSIIPPTTSAQYKVEELKPATCQAKGSYKYTYLKDDQEITFEYECYGNHTNNPVCKTCGEIIDESFFNTIHLDEIKDVSLDIKKLEYQVASEKETNTYTFNGNIKGVLDEESYIELFGDIEIKKASKNLETNVKVTTINEYSMYYYKNSVYLNDGNDIISISPTDTVDENEPYYPVYYLVHEALTHIATEGKLELKDIETKSGYALINSIFKLADYEDDYKFVLDGSKIKNYNEILYTESISAIIDSLLGKDTVKSLLNTINNKVLDLDSAIFANTVIEKNKDSIDNVEATINEYATNITGSSFELKSILNYETTLSDYLYGIFNVEGKTSDTINSYINNNAILGLVFGNEFNVKDFINNNANKLSEKTVYELITEILNAVDANLPQIYALIEAGLDSVEGYDLSQAKATIETIKALVTSVKTTPTTIYSNVNTAITVITAYASTSYFVIDSETGVVNKLHLTLANVSRFGINVPSGTIDVLTNTGVTITEGNKALFNL